jgi:nucleoid DNA-binding protein
MESLVEYSKLISMIAERTGISEEIIRNVLSAFPEIIMEGSIGEKTRTPLGVFTLVERKVSKPVKTPTGHSGIPKPMTVARLKPGKKLQQEESNQSSSTTQLDLNLDSEDPST